MIYLETGANKDNDLIIDQQVVAIAKENKMPTILKDQYQHNGSGTAIIINKKYGWKPTRQMFNDHKHIASIMTNEYGKRWVLAGIHAENGDGKNK